MRPKCVELGCLVVAMSALAIAGNGRLKVQPFALQDVRLLDGPFLQAMERDREYLLSLEPDRLLQKFRVTAGLPAPGRAYGGWEGSELRGHTMGHYLSACALMYASTGDERFKSRIDGIVTELAKCQKALGESGYLSAYPESFIDRVEARRQVWAPYYTLHKIMAGLLDCYVHAGNRQAFDVLEKMAQWCKGRCDKLSDEQMQGMLNSTEQGGMNDVLAGLYAVTGNPDHLALSRRFVQRTYVEPLAARRDQLKDQHANSFIPNIIGTARQYEVAGDEQDRRIAEYFWHEVVGHRCYCTGGTSNDEHWRTDPDQLASELGDHTQECCCTYNLLKLTRHVYSWDPRPEYMDYYERALFNSILSTQDPKTGMMMYFVTLAPGRWKFYNTPEDSFWCCTGTGMENHAKYGDTIYYHDSEGVFVNLFIASELNWRDMGVRLRQETKWPDVSVTSLTIRADQPKEFSLRVRIPAWATSGVTVKLNGKPLAVEANPSSYTTVRRTWSDGDRLDISMPMSLHVVPMPDDKTLVAFQYGPLVLAGKLGGDGLTDNVTYLKDQWYQFPLDEVAEASILLYANDDPSSCIEKVADDPPVFRAVGLEKDVTLVPYHQLFGQRYTVYWRAFHKGSPEHVTYVAEEKIRADLKLRTVDEVAIGDPRSEPGHRMKGERTAKGLYFGRAWRHASDGGWFSYDLKVLPDVAQELRIGFWGSDAGGREFDILVDGVNLATLKLENNRPGTFYDETYPLPKDLLANKTKVTVRFQAHPGMTAGGIFGCAILKMAK